MYGDAMRKPLPISDFQWVSSDDELFFNVESIMKLSDDSEYGYIFEADLHYPKNLHDIHNDYPFCAEKRPLPDEVFNILKIKKNKTEKLLLTLYDKERYVVHYGMLKLAIRHGLIVKKVHQILRFKQSCWLKPYIELNIELRKLAKNDFEKEFFKLFINVIFGKTIENLRLRVDIKLVNKWGGKFGARMLIAKPNFKRCRIFDEELVAIELEKTSIFMNKPIIVGMCVLDISKTSMYKFLYEYLKPKYNDKCTVAYTDTDSFILCIQTPNFYEDIRSNIEIFDTSDFPWPNQYNIERKNKKIPGKFKDELNGNIMVEFVGLRAKCYAIRTLNLKSYDIIKRNKGVKKCKLKAYDITKKAKGVKKCVVKGKIMFKHYVQCLRNNSDFKCKQNTIRSIQHSVYSIRQEKIALNSADDKRYVIEPDRIDTLAWGHHKILDVYEKRETK